MPMAMLNFDALASAPVRGKNVKKLGNYFFLSNKFNITFRKFGFG
jgi:hypothetical protein